MLLSVENREPHKQRGQQGKIPAKPLVICVLMDGPAVSLNGSPTVSPMTAALWASLPLPPSLPGLHVFLGIVPQAAGVGHEQSQQQAAEDVAQQEAANGGGAADEAHDQRGDDGS